MASGDSVDKKAGGDKTVVRPVLLIFATIMRIVFPAFDGGQRGQRQEHLCV